jgi:hypothetical protein
MDTEGRERSIYIFRSYNNYSSPGTKAKLENPHDANNYPIWQVGRATSAAPTFFKPMQIGNELFSDGGLRYNNPAEKAFLEVRHKEDYFHKKRRNRNTPVPVGLLLSIGTGGNDANLPLTQDDEEEPVPRRQRWKSIKKHFHNLGDRVTKAATTVDAVDHTMRDRSADDDWSYFRWAGGTELEKLKLDRWRPQKGSKPSTQTDIENWMSNYMDEDGRKREIEEIAEIMVYVRRKRVIHGGGDRWQRFTYCSRLLCPHCPCQFNTQSELEDHIAEIHAAGGQPSRYRPKVPGGPY